LKINCRPAESRKQQLKKEIEQLKLAEKEREEAKKEFEPLFEEYKKQVEEVERVTGVIYDDAVEMYNIGAIVTDSKELERHYRRLAKDREYRQRYKIAVSSKVEKQQQEIEHKLFKTFAE